MTFVKTSALSAAIALITTQIICVFHAGAQQIVVDEVVAEIDNEAITYFEVLRFWRLERLIEADGDWRKAPAKGELGKTVVKYVNRLALLQEMDRMQTETQEGKEREKAEKTFDGAFKNDAERELFLSLTSYSKEEAVRTMLRQRQLGAFLERRASFYVSVSDGEAEEEAAKAAKKESVSVEEWRALIESMRTKLSRKKFESFMYEWLKELYRRRSVNFTAKWVIDPFSGAVEYKLF